MAFEPSTPSTFTALLFAELRARPELAAIPLGKISSNDLRDWDTMHRVATSTLPGRAAPLYAGDLARIALAHGAPQLAHDLGAIAVERGRPLGLRAAPLVSAALAVQRQAARQLDREFGS